MLSMLAGASKVVGAKQVLRAIANDDIRCVFIATDADMFVTRPVFDACRAKNIEIVEVPSMKALGEACGVQVKAAAAAVKR